MPIHTLVRAWLGAQTATTLFLSSITVAKILFGIGTLPNCKRKDMLAAALDDVLDLFSPRILSFDTIAARRHAELAVEARAAGKGFPTPDGYIAAIAAAHGFAVATRDASAFDAAGLTVIDPWTSAAGQASFPWPVGATSSASTHAPGRCRTARGASGRP